MTTSDYTPRYSPEQHIERFWSKVNKNGSIPVHMPHLGNCWEWTAACRGSMGYGVKFWEHKHQYTHRISWMIHFGEIPMNLRVLHKCDNPKCVRPEHLFLGTQQDNVDDMAKKGRKVIGDHYSNRKGECNPKAKVTNAQVLEIRKRFTNGDDRHLLAHEYGVTVPGIMFIINKRQI